MNKYKCTFPPNHFLEVYPEEDNTTVALKVRTGLPADKAISLIELDTEAARNMAEFILIDILAYHIVNNHFENGDLLNKRELENNE